MKKAVYLLSSLLIILISCSKDENPDSPFTGIYKGTIIDSGFHGTGTFTDTLKDHTIIVTMSAITPGYVFLHNGLIRTNEGKITGEHFIIERRLASKDQFFEVYEWADGKFSGTAKVIWTANFYRESISDGKVIARIRRNAFLVKE